MYSRTPAYNLKVVLTETGIAADTLRAWERRYGLPQPQRTAGGHRLYTQRDIEMVKWLIARQAEGLSISRAKRWKGSKCRFGKRFVDWRSRVETIQRAGMHSTESFVKRIPVVCFGKIRLFFVWRACIISEQTINGG